MIRYNEKLADHTSLGIGGEAFCWIEVEDFTALLEAVSFLEKNQKPLLVFGEGSNLLVCDRGFDGGVLHLSGEFDFIEKGPRNLLRVGSVTPLWRLVKETGSLGLGGCEFLYGIPGSFGGAVFMNAGVRDLENRDRFKEISSILTDLEVLDLKDKKKKKILAKDIDFGYRRSGLEDCIILNGTLELETSSKDKINEKIECFKKKRAWMSRLNFPSAGSVFKNPDCRNPAGRLIEDCGLKGKKVGGAQISGEHANFIVNRGGATSQDVLDLIEIVKGSVKEKFGIELELEIRVI